MLSLSAAQMEPFTEIQWHLVAHGGRCTRSNVAAAPHSVAKRLSG